MNYVGVDLHKQVISVCVVVQEANTRLARTGVDARLEARIEAFEMAFRMQMHAPEVMEVGEEPTDEYARHERPNSCGGSYS